LFVLGWAELFYGRMVDAEEHLVAAIAAWRDLGIASRRVWLWALWRPG
jgi:hypothetical protein